jgi:[ribosomal protein S5]-alanine N-acetyltransferase
VRGEQVYEECPVYAYDHFVLRQVEMADAEDLLRCYSDESAVRLMNADNCNSDFNFKTIEEMRGYIAGWLEGQKRCVAIRFAIVDKEHAGAIGTVEMFPKTREVGILRIDLCAAYEKKNSILEVLALSVPNFHKAFDVPQVLMKAIPEATERVSALLEYGFVPVDVHAMQPHKHYYEHRNV